MLELVDLAVHRGVHTLIAVPHADGHNPAEKIEIFVAVSVPDELVFGPLNDQRLRKVMEYRREQVLAAGENDF
jgi:hypothetical protein